MREATVVVGEPRMLLRRLLVSLIDSDLVLKVVAEAGNSDDVVKACQETRPRLVLLSPRLVGRSPFAAAHTLRRDFPHTAIVFFSADLRDKFLSSAGSINPEGFLTTSEDPESFLAALRAIAIGKRVLSVEVESRLRLTERLAEVKPRVDTLTNREIEVLSCIAQGMTKQEIAKILGRSVKTVSSHSSNLMFKLNIHDRVSLARYAFREGFATP